MSQCDIESRICIGMLNVATLLAHEFSEWVRFHFPEGAQDAFSVHRRKGGDLPHRCPMQ
jgi:hypothetical protein